MCGSVGLRKSDSLLHRERVVDIEELRDDERLEFL